MNKEEGTRGLCSCTHMYTRVMVIEKEVSNLKGSGVRGMSWGERAQENDVHIDSTHRRNSQNTKAKNKAMLK